MIRSLSTRLLIWLVGAQIILVIIAMLLFPLLAPYTTYSEIAEYTARHNLLASLRRGDNGQIHSSQGRTGCPTRTVVLHLSLRSSISINRALLQVRAKSYAKLL